MTESKKSFVFYHDWYEDFISKMNDSQKVSLLDAICQYSIYQTEPDFAKDLVLNITFDHIRRVLDQDGDKWTSTRQARSEAGKKGGAPQGNQNAAKNKQKQAKQTKQAVNVNENVNINVNENENENDNANENTACFDSIDDIEDLDSLSDDISDWHRFSRPSYL